MLVFPVQLKLHDAVNKIGSSMSTGTKPETEVNEDNEGLAKTFLGCWLGQQDWFMSPLRAWWAVNLRLTGKRTLGVAGADAPGSWPA